MAGDPTLFIRANQINQFSSVIALIANAWTESLTLDFPNYPAGSWGSQAAVVLVA
jgi:glucose-6-phosphate 1-dehydrogenase